MKTEIYTAYSKDTDMTFIMRDTFNGDDLIATECVGWYYGIPDDDTTTAFCGKLKAEY